VTGVQTCALPIYALVAGTAVFRGGPAAYAANILALKSA
jgi:hypothetical protein